MYFYKIRNALVHVDHLHLISTRNLNYLIPHSSTQYHSNSYFPRTIRLWNSLPGRVQASPSLAIFTTRLAAVPFHKTIQFIFIFITSATTWHAPPSYNNKWLLGVYNRTRTGSEPCRPVKHKCRELVWQRHPLIWNSQLNCSTAHKWLYANVVA